jgi:L-fuconolactonase
VSGTSEGLGMAKKPDRIVDGHVHEWDPSNAEWYPFLQSADALVGIGMDNTAAMMRLFDQATYFAESSAWPIEKYVHVTAVHGPFFVAETKGLQAEADRLGHPDGIVGGFDPEAPLRDVVGQLQSQQESPNFRGVRAGGEVDHDGPGVTDLLRELRDRRLVYDVMLHPEHMASAARAFERVDDLVVVVEHTGWPLAEDDAHFRLWRSGMAALAAAGAAVHCKLSGLAMVLHRADVAGFRPWIEASLDLFGVDRCFFSSNFPVDGVWASFDALYSVYSELTADLPEEDRARLFAGNAEEVYRI